MNYTGQTSFADMFEYYCTRNVTNEREYNEREMLRWLKQKLEQVHRDATEEVAKAHKRGWEQAKAEAVMRVQSKRHEYRCEASEASRRGFPELEKSYLSKYRATADIFDAISAMKYKEPAK